MRNDELRRIRPWQRIVWRRRTDEPVELLLVEEALERYEQWLSDIGIGYRWYQDSSGTQSFDTYCDCRRAVWALIKQRLLGIAIVADSWAQAYSIAEGVPEHTDFLHKLNKVAWVSIDNKEKEHD